MTSTAWHVRRLAAGIAPWAVSLVLLYLAFHKSEWRTVFREMARTDLLYVTIAMALQIGGYAIAGLRWRKLLLSGQNVPRADAIWFFMAGQFANVVLPLRAGDIGRAVVANRYAGVSVSYCLSAVAGEKILDLFVLLSLALGAIPLAAVPAAVGPIVAGSWIALTIGTAVLLAVTRDPVRAAARLSRWTGFLSDRANTLLREGAARFADGLAAIRRPRTAPMAFLATLGFWTMAAVAVVCVVKAFQIPVPWYAPFYILALTNLSFAIPSSPGAIGVYHYLAMLAITPWVPDRNAALAFAIVSHGTFMLASILCGLVALGRIGLKGRRGDKPADLVRDTYSDAPAQGGPRP